ncbi:hypothetical protein PR003_g22466 [Phytophthora rubi]|uniref:Uncharacterized protein n=1 Tax=Phytophthora rubi TaxID=129364 RepID=A0A6A4D9P6_9STRA|nr:hypothetical protein PR003_g22466 [Phytophthora rubi]
MDDWLKTLAVKLRLQGRLGHCREDECTLAPAKYDTYV